jgi:hypothetical protein
MKKQEYEKFKLKECKHKFIFAGYTDFMSGFGKCIIIFCEKCGYAKKELIRNR